MNFELLMPQCTKPDFCIDGWMMVDLTFTTIANTTPFACTARAANGRLIVLC